MPTVYCTQRDVINRLSEDGVTYRVDDAPPDLWGDVLDDASSQIEEYCLPNYDTAQMAGNRWVKHRCADLAGYLLCERRGNPVPPGVAEKFDRAIGRLELVHKGTLKIPGLTPRRVSAPTGSNLRVRLDPFPRVVVERNRSPSRNRPQDYAERTDSLEWYDYSIALWPVLLAFGAAFLA